MFTDTYFSNTKYYNRNKVTQIFTIEFNWTKVYNFKNESDTYYSLDQLFKKVGILSLLILNNSKAQTKGQFNKKCLEAHCSKKPINTY